MLYLGDTARVPYGTKSSEVVTRYALNCTRHLIEAGAKAIVVACNTASAAALPVLQAAYNVPVLGVIEPGARAAVARSTGGRIGVIGTESTINSGRYQTWLKKLRPDVTVFAQACPLLVPLAEENMVKHPATRLLIAEYLAPLLKAQIDTLVLGCTHYPILGDDIAAAAPGIAVVDSADVVAEALHASLANSQKFAEGAPDHLAPLRLMATDVSDRLYRVGSAFLGESLPRVEWVDVSALP